jgi:exopolysaccharide production protein ExoY
VSAAALESVVEVPEIPIGGNVKRTFDTLFAILLLVLFSPLLLLVFLLIRLVSPGPVLYRHERIGFGGRPFYCYKFRTMRLDAKKELEAVLSRSPAMREEWLSTRKLRKDPRLIPFGRALRRLSLDELPQLWNVVCGDMSLVGPRPVPQDELDAMYGPRSKEYISARPGITGLWQVSGRSSVGYDQRVEFDRRYVNEWSLTKDMVILGRTIPAVFSISDAS